MKGGRFKVRFTADADRDLDDIYAYVAQSRSIEEADSLVALLLERSQALASFPDRGSVPAELDVLGERNYRQVVNSPYRIIYLRINDTVFIYLIADGRRDMRALLRQRLLGQ